MVKISVITINYNNATGLANTIESVIQQSYPYIEYIVIDGGSTDDSVAIIKEKASKIDFWVSEPDKGIYHAMNKGIAKASGDYLIFINSGDYLYSSTILEEVVPQLDKDIVYGAADWRDGSGSELHVFPEKLTLDYFYRASLPHQSSFICRKVFDKTGLYTESFKIASDWELWVKAIFKHGCTYKRIPETVSIFDATGVSNGLEGKKILQAEKEEVFCRYFAGIHEDYVYAHQIRQFFYTHPVLKALRKLKVIRLEGLFRNAKNGY